MAQPLPESFIEIESDPEFQSFGRMARKQIRDGWVETKMGRLGYMSTEDKEAYRTKLMEEAYERAEEWQKPMKPPEMPGFGGALLEAGTRMASAPQQLVANILKGAGKGAEEGEPFWYPAVRPLQQTLKYMTDPEAKETTLPGGEFTRTVTDPLMWTTMGGAGLALMLKGKTAAEIAAMAAQNPRLQALLKMPGLGATRKIATTVGKVATPQALSRVPGALMPKYTELEPKAQTLYRQVSAWPSLRMNVPPKQIPEYARTYVASRGPQRKMMGEMLATPKGEAKLSKWLEQPPHLRARPKGEGPVYLTEFGEQPPSVVEQMTQGKEWVAEPQKVRATYESLESQISGAAQARDEALNLPPVITKRVKKVPKPPKKVKSEVK